MNIYYEDFKIKFLLKFNNEFFFGNNLKIFYINLSYYK